MFANQRQDEIYNLIKEKGNVTVDELMKKFDVSVETIRRDLIFLEKANSIKRVHGGAISVQASRKHEKFKKRLEENRPEKRELAKTAINLIEEGDFISIDAGTTTIELVDEIKKHFHELVIVTNSGYVVEALRGMESFKIYLTGGIFMHDENAFYGEIAINNIKNFYIKKAFICPAGISENGISDFDQELSDVQKAYIEAAEKKIILADSSKIGKDAFIKTAELTSDFVIITDSHIDEEKVKSFAEKDICILGKAEN